MKVYKMLFKMPTTMNITGRSSSITNAFFNAIIPVVKPSAEEVKHALEILEMTPETFQCAYCGDVASEWDHLRPLIMDKMPTGYISEIQNLVPSCGKCNQSKGNQEWRTWMVSTAPRSPTSRMIENIAERIKLLEAYENWRTPTRIIFESVVGKEIWSQHFQNMERVQNIMRESQELAVKIKHLLANAHKDL